MQSTASQTFDALVREINTAIKERGFFAVCERAAELGLSGERTESRFALRYRFEGTDSSGGTVSLFARSYDPSGPTQIRPGVTRFTITAMENGAVMSQFEDEYEGLVKA